LGAVIAGVAVLLVACAALLDELAIRRRRARALDVNAILRARLKTVHGPALLEAIEPASETAEAATAVLWNHLADAVDPARFRPRIADDVEVRIFRLRWGNDYAMVANPRALIHYRLEVWEAELLPLMDGTRTMGDIVVERLAGSGELDTSGVTALVEMMRLNGFMSPQPINVEGAVRDGLDRSSRFRRRLRSFAKTLSIEWTGADRFVRWWYRVGVRAFFTPVGAVVTALMAVAGLAAFVEVERRHQFHLNSHAAPAESLALLALGLVLTFAHELGHAVVIVHHGRRVKSAGFMVYFGSPTFFIESSDVMMLDRRERIVQSFAGPFAELAIAGIAAVVILVFPSWRFAPLFYRFALLNYFIIFLNLIPLLELDGYWILSDAIQVPDLRPRSLAFIQHDLWHKLRQRERLTPQQLGLGGYAIIGIAFTILSFFTAYFFWKEIFGGLVLSLWRGGFVSRGLLVLLAVFLGGPAIRGLIAFAKAIFVRARAIGRRIRFRLETSWRVEAAQLIDALPAFEDLPAEILNDLAGRVALRTVANGQTLFRQGDRASAFYVVRRGTIEIEASHPETGDVQVLATLGRGGSFGELGLIEAAPRRATARAKGETELFEVDKGSFDRLLADAIEVPAFAHTLQSLAELRDMTAFHQVQGEALSELLEHGEWVNAAPGEELVVEGEPGDAFYSIHRGQVEVIRGGEKIGDAGPGGFFGEAALLHDAPRNATVVARTPVRAFRLSREGFDRVIADAFRRGTLKAPIGRTIEH
jgi:putative peptide zinc metalloprotease protein